MLLSPWLFMVIALAALLAAPMAAFIVVKGCWLAYRRWGWRGELGGWLASFATVVLIVFLLRSRLGFDAMVADPDDADWMGAAIGVLALQVWAAATLMFAMLMRFDKQIIGIRKSKGR